MRFRFTKMHGLGNDFVMLDGVSQKLIITPERAKHISDRNFGIGCDQILLVEPPKSSDADFKYRIFNADGSEVENCGNGARCFALFVRQRGLTNKRQIKVQTNSGDMVLHVREDDQVTVNMGEPILEPTQIPFQAPNQQTIYGLDIEGARYEISSVSMGNPHSVMLVDDVVKFPVHIMGPLVESHINFPKKTNAGFMQIIDKQNMKLRVFERGCGETLACGTGACAAAVAAQLRGLIDTLVHINLPGGQLIIEWQGPGTPVYMTGPATTVFHGQMKL